MLNQIFKWQVYFNAALWTDSLNYESSVKINKAGEVDYKDLIYYLDCENQPANLEIQNEGVIIFQIHIGIIS
jgi:hypothetical protein